MTAVAAKTWRPDWLTTSVADLGLSAWRGVEAQHVVSTMRLVDNLDEQAELERILERSKPALPAAAASVHFLLSTPFRYRPAHASRFRKAGTLGLWYGADTLRTACAEVAYWRWRFLLDSAALMQQSLLTVHTFFAARVQGRAVDLMQPPWSACRPLWTHGSDYSQTQALADAACDEQVQWIRYESVRDPGGQCAAVLNVAALTLTEPVPQQTWHCKTTRSAVLMVHGQDRFSWEF
jgi:RES domain